MIFVHHVLPDCMAMHLFHTGIMNNLFPIPLPPFPTDSADQRMFNVRKLCISTQAVREKYEIMHARFWAPSKKNLISLRNVTLFWNIESWGTSMISPLQKVTEIRYLLQYIQQNSRQQWTKSLKAPIWSSVPVPEINCICRASDLYSRNWAMLENKFDSATIIQPVMLWVPSGEPDISALKLHGTLKAYFFHCSCHGSWCLFKGSLLLYCVEGLDNITILPIIVIFCPNTTL